MKTNYFSIFCITVFQYLFSWVDIWWCAHDHPSSHRVVATFYGMFCHLVVRTHRGSSFHVIGSMWYHLVGTIHTCSVLIRWPCDLASIVLATDQIHRSRCVHQSVPARYGVLKYFYVVWNIWAVMEVVTEEAVSAKIYPGLEETPEFRGMLFLLHFIYCAWHHSDVISWRKSGNRYECIWTFL